MIATRCLNSVPQRAAWGSEGRGLSCGAYGAFAPLAGLRPAPPASQAGASNPAVPIRRTQSLQAFSRSSCTEGERFTRILRRPSDISMHLAHVEVRNFRCLRELRVDLQQDLNLLVGRNNVGKTSLLAAIRHALGAGAGRDEGLWLTEDDFHRPGPGGFPSMYLFHQRDK